MKFTHKSKKYLEGLIKEEKITPHFIFTHEPAGKEYSINQIREIGKEIKYSASERHLYILKQFDTASFEAQNAFLKTLEEHSPMLIFVLMVQNHKRLLPTVMSRSKLIILDRVEQVDIAPETTQLIESLMKGSLKNMGSSYVEKRLKSDPEDLLLEFLFYFRNRYESDRSASKIMRKITTNRNLLIQNNISAQTVFDDTCIYLYKIYKKS